MSLSVIADNQSIKVSAAVSNSLTTTTGTLYTCAANSYAIVQVNLPMAGTSSQGTLSVGGVVVKTINASEVFQGIYVGPGQVVAYAWNGSNGAAQTISGVEFINTP